MELFRGSEWRKWDLHLHTAPSYDAHRYHGNVEAVNNELIETLRENEISAVAITDHFTINAENFLKLRDMAKDIVFFPGVELRTDKGAPNIHVILIFSEESDVCELAQRFKVIMRNQKAKANDSDDTIYWDFDDIIEFARDNQGIISIHAGKKDKGLEQITNKLPTGMAIKEEIFSQIDILEVGKYKDVKEYNEIVFKKMGEDKPVIICSDNHDPSIYPLSNKDEKPKPQLWIKADRTFEGLKQCCVQPAERIYLGAKPQNVIRLETHKYNYIDSISIKRISNPKFIDYTWFDSKIHFNPALVAIIGNKGSGKSALSDILALAGHSTRMEEASFLTRSRFQRKPNYSTDYRASMVWQDGSVDEIGLDAVADGKIERVQYLPQSYIEKLCNSLGDEFQKEIDRTIFSHLDEVERLGEGNLYDLLGRKTKVQMGKLNTLRSEMRRCNHKLSLLESKLLPENLAKLRRELKEKKQRLINLENNKPKTVTKPAGEKQTEIDALKNQIDELTANKTKLTIKATDIAQRLNLVEQGIGIIDEVEFFLNRKNRELREIYEKLDMRYKEMHIDGSARERLHDLKEDYKLKKESINIEISGRDENDQDSIDQRILKLEQRYQSKTAEASNDVKAYEDYQNQFKTWQLQKEELIGDDKKIDSIKGIEHEIQYYENGLKDDVKCERIKQINIAEKIHKEIVRMKDQYWSIYRPVANRIENILSNTDSKVKLSAEIRLQNESFGAELLKRLDMRVSGEYDSQKIRIQNGIVLRDTDFNDFDEMRKMLQVLLMDHDNDFPRFYKRVKNLEEFYNEIFSMEYLGIEYLLSMDGKKLPELSPGERGLLLLVFYLALDKHDSPLIIDQPEDNLDNQSIFEHLVPAIRNAKQRRQIFIVTHNPNIAVACDAEQVIYCYFDKQRNHIEYEAGSLENSSIRSHILDVLEGTKPAFLLRKNKYGRDLQE